MLPSIKNPTLPQRQSRILSAVVHARTFRGGNRMCIVVLLLVIFTVIILGVTPLVIQKLRPPPPKVAPIDNELYKTGLEVAKLAESLERRTVRMKNERNWPKESLAKLEKLLDDYQKLHADILAGKIPGGKYIRWTCLSMCFGWGDRIRGIMSVLTLALISQRAFVVELKQVGVKLNEFYSDSNIRWTSKPKFETEKLLECNTPPNRCNCLTDGMANYSSVDMISIHTNQDCAGHFAPMLPDWKDENGRGIVDVLNWRGMLMDRVFPLTLKLRSVIQSTLPQGFDVGMHIRSGYISHNDPIRFKGSPEQLSEDYASCLTKVHPDVGTVYIASDNSTFHERMTNTISSSYNVVDSAWIGGWGHVQNFPREGPNMVWRMMVDFEILRRSKILLVGPSGFSLFAFKLRVFPDARAFAPLKSKLVEKCDQMFMNATAKSYWLLDAV